jgi:hypothetical protein
LTPDEIAYVDWLAGPTATRLGYGKSDHDLRSGFVLQQLALFPSRRSAQSRSTATGSGESTPSLPLASQDFSYGTDERPRGSSIEVYFFNRAQALPTPPSAAERATLCSRWM